MVERLFVYGTLAPGGPNGHVNNAVFATFLETGRVEIDDGTKRGAPLTDKAKKTLGGWLLK